MGPEPVGVSRDRTSEAEEAHGHDRRGQREDGRTFGGARDQIAGGGHQRDAEDDRQRPERRRDRDPGDAEIPDSASRRRRTPSRDRLHERPRRRPLSSRTTRSAAGGELWAVGDQQDACGWRRQLIDRVARRSRRSSGSRFAVGSSRTTNGASRRNARASAIRWVCPAESGRPPSPTKRLVAVRQRRDELVGAGERAPRARTQRRRLPGSPRRMFSATVPRSSVGRCGTQASCRRQASGSHAATSTPSAVTRPSPASARRSSREAIVLFPAPLGPTSATVSPARELEVDASSAGRCAAGIAERRPARAGSSPSAGPGRGAAPARRRPARLDEVEQPSGDGRAVGAGVELRRRRCGAAGRARARARARSARPAKPRPPSTSRTPTVTATSATPSVAASSSTAPERKATRSVPIVATPVPVADGARSAPPARGPVEGAERRQPADDVGEVVREERERLPAFSRSMLGVAADEPHEDRHERKRHQHDPGGGEVDRRDEREHRDGDERGQHDLRQVAGEGRLERVDARHRERRRARRSRRRRARPDCRAAGARRGPAGAARGSARPRAGRPPRSPTRPPPARQTTAASSASGTDDRVQATRRRTSARPRSARSTAWARTSSAATSPSTASAASATRASRARCRRRGSNAAICVRRRVSRPGLGSAGQLLAADPGAEDVVRPALVEEDERDADQRRRRS